MKILLKTLPLAIAAALPLLSLSAAPVRVMSFNIRFDTPKDTGDCDWGRRQEPCRRMFAEIAPDLVGMQEPREEMLPATYAMLPGYGHFKIEACDTITDKQTGNNVIFYRHDRFEPVDSGYFWLSATPERPSLPWNSTDTHYRTALWMRLRDRLDGREIYFVTTHFPYKGAPVDTEVRALCADLICRRMRQIAGDSATVYITGDMNAADNPGEGRAPSLAPFFEHTKSARREARFTNPRSSFNGFGRVEPTQRHKNLDHIFYRNATPVLFETIDYPGYGVRWISDHYPIMCTFE